MGISHHVKFFVNKGNNHPTIRAILKKRWWYASVESAADKDDASILWTVWKKQKILGKLPKLSTYIASIAMAKQASDGQNTRPDTTNSFLD